MKRREKATVKNAIADMLMREYDVNEEEAEEMAEDVMDDVEEELLDGNLDELPTSTDE